MRASSYQKLIERLDALEVSPEAKRLMESVVRQQAMEDGVSILYRRERVELARHLLDQRVERPVICNRLMELYGITESTANRDISKALQLAQIPAKFGT